MVEKLNIKKEIVKIVKKLKETVKIRKNSK